MVAEANAEVATPLAENENSAAEGEAHMEIEAIGHTVATGVDPGERSDQAKPTIAEPAANESFKENPYTFLTADDPILISCVYV